MTCGVYQIVNTVNGKRYVGSSVNIEARWKHHIWRLNRGSHHSPYLQNSWNKYGEHCFTFAILSENEEDNIHAAEQIEIDIKSEYNVAPLAGSIRGHKWTEEQKAAHSESKVKFYECPDARAKMSKAVRAAQEKPEVRKAISDGTKKGQSKPGVKERMSAALTERWNCPEYREKMTETARAMKYRPAHLKAVIAANTRPRNESIYNFSHPQHGDRLCTQWLLKKEFPELRSNNLSQVCSGSKGSHAGWTIKKAPS